MLAFLVISVLLLVLPALFCCAQGGWLLLFGVLALVGWLQLGWWVAESWWSWRRGEDDYV
ncbi:MAG TPA: hypothetical protein IAB00_00310 [Candidatus Avidehalobacter gallistercoris]|uniref:Uncharacterized protein n=1 Tax=Candidatus Avidehalobacter gallistercoris TaxID=2840694 RepID=A0A9D1KXX3_9FIRM|nr:hypothetical protein [Candidatus Avidehalobacter gallistercoris]